MRSFTAIALLVFLTLAGCAKDCEPGAADRQQQPQGTAATPTQAAPAQQASGKVEVAPAEPKQGDKITVTMELKDASGQPISDAQVSAALTMAMGDSPMREQTELNWDGKRYQGTITPSMAGSWDVEVRATKGGNLLLSMPANVVVK